jgi:hypothetical protein
MRDFRLESVLVVSPAHQGIGSSRSLKRPLRRDRQGARRTGAQGKQGAIGHALLTVVHWHDWTQEIGAASAVSISGETSLHEWS